MNLPAQIEKENRSPLDRIAYAIATGAGAGYAPIAPGTVGSIEGVVLFIATLAFQLSSSDLLLLLAALNVIIYAVGVWASTRTCAMCGLEDPRLVVIDEVSGQLIALTPLAFAPSAMGVIAAFLLFRLFDIFKPYPIRRLEHLHGGFGVMTDDVLAGLYAAALVWLGIQSGLL